MKNIQCNCLTKTPEPEFHMQNCPVWMEDRINKLEALLGESVPERDGRPGCSASFHIAARQWGRKVDRCPICEEAL